MDVQLNRYIKKQLLSGVAFIVWTGFSIFSGFHYRCILLFVIGTANLLGALYLRKKYKTRTEPPSFEALDVMTKFPAWWMAIAAIEVVAFLLLIRVYKIEHAKE